MREATEKRILGALERNGITWITINELAKKAEAHYYAILVYVAHHRNKLDRVTYGRHVYLRLKA